MTITAVSLVIALALTVGGPALLRGLDRTRASTPRVMLLLWASTTVAWLLAWLTVVLRLVADVMGPGLKGVITACVTLFQAVHRNGAEIGVSALFVGGLLLLVRLLWVAARHSRHAFHWRRVHYRELCSYGEPRTVQGQRVWVVPTSRPDVYCLPGRRLGIVVTQGALDALTPRETRAVLAHERAHLRGGHHALVAWSHLLNTAFPRIPLLSAAAVEIPLLVEWAADDHAARAVGTAPLAHALGAVATAASTASRGTEALAASGSCTVRRVRRLLTPVSHPAGLRHRLLLSATALLVLTVPSALILTATVLGVVTTQCVCAA